VVSLSKRFGPGAPAGRERGDGSLYGGCLKSKKIEMVGLTSP